MECVTWKWKCLHDTNTKHDADAEPAAKEKKEKKEKSPQIKKSKK